MDPSLYAAADDPEWVTACPTAFPDAPYPGLRPVGSWRLTADASGDAVLHRLRPDGGGWRDEVTGERVDPAGRDLVLGYASNLNPPKLAAKLPGEVIVLAVAVHGWAAAWCDARRSADGSVVATLAPRPGATEVFGVLAVTEHQLERMDAWEGHPGRYRRQAFAGRCTLVETGREVAAEVYLGTEELRPTQRLDGTVVFCRDVPYATADRLVARNSDPPRA